jgi:hypothetical protein
MQRTKFWNFQISHAVPYIRERGLERGWPPVRAPRAREKNAYPPPGLPALVWSVLVGWLVTLQVGPAGGLPVRWAGLGLVASTRKVFAQYLVYSIGCESICLRLRDLRRLWPRSRATQEPNHKPLGCADHKRGYSCSCVVGAGEVGSGSLAGWARSGSNRAADFGLSAAGRREPGRGRS